MFFSVRVFGRGDRFRGIREFERGRSLRRDKIDGRFSFRMKELNSYLFWVIRSFTWRYVLFRDLALRGM